MSIADNIKTLRKRQGITQVELAKRSGLAVITIQNYEAGKYEPKRESLYKLRKGLDCNINEILDKPFTVEASKIIDLTNCNTEEETQEKLNIYFPNYNKTLEKEQDMIAQEKEKSLIFNFIEILKNNPKLDKALMDISQYFLPNTKCIKNFNIEKRAELYSLLYDNIVYNKQTDTIEISPYIPPTELIIPYNKLNEHGKTEAIKRINELSKIKEYTEPENT